MAFRRVGPPKIKTVAKIRRTAAQAYTKNWDAISKANIDAHGRRCSKCGTTGSATNKLRSHHIVNVSNGGKTVPYYLTCLCDNCHAKQPGHKHLNKKKSKKF